MNTSNLINAYSNYITSGMSFKDIVAKALNSKGYLDNKVIEQLAETHATAYGTKYKRTIFYKQTSSGTWSFYTDEACTRENRDDTALRQWQRDVQIYQALVKKAKTVKQVDEVAKQAKAIQGKFSKAQITKLIKLLTA